MSVRAHIHSQTTLIDADVLQLVLQCVAVGVAVCCSVCCRVLQSVSQMTLV